MTTNQYHCVVKDNEFETKEGHFFKAGAFEITINSTLYNVTFEPINHTIVYKVIHNTTTITELIHPDYAPNCDITNINQTLNNNDMQTLFIALCKHNICIHKDYLKFIEDNPDIKVSYEIVQKAVI